MSQTYDLYVERARAAEAAAEETALVNVREREMRSAKAWREMADRQLLMEAERVRADEVRAARREAERTAAAADADESHDLET